MKPRIIHEGDPLPSQKDAEPRFTMSGMGLVLQGQISGFQIALEQQIDATADEEYVNERVDFMSKVIGRMKAKSDLVEKLFELHEEMESIARLPAGEAMAMKDLERNKLQHIASLQAKRAGKRVEFKLTPAEEANLQQFEIGKKTIADSFAQKKTDGEAKCAAIKRDIDRLRAIIAGADPTEEPLPVAAE